MEKIPSLTTGQAKWLVERLIATTRITTDGVRRGTLLRELKRLFED
jgi:hypothetical protein